VDEQSDRAEFAHKRSSKERVAVLIVSEDASTAVLSQAHKMLSGISDFAKQKREGVPGGFCCIVELC
jgi:hypothetical protein